MYAIFITDDQQHGGMLLITLYFSACCNSLQMQNAPALASGVTSNCGPPQTNVRGPPALPRTSSGNAMVSGARGIDHFGALPLPSPPFRST